MKITTVSGQGFDAGVMNAGPHPFTPAEPVPQIDDPALTALSQLAAGLEGEEKETCSMLIQKRFVLNSLCVTFIGECREKAAAKLETAHEELKERCLAQIEEIKKLRNRLSRLEMEMNKANEVEGEALVAEQSALADRAELSRFASKSQIKKVEEAVAAARARVANAGPRKVEIRVEMHRIQLVDLPAAHERMRELEAQERAVRHSLTGEVSETALGTGFLDEFGLLHPVQR
jgi:hypothetical protein